jgi:acetyl-CoA carboxylase biotin carboxyl carrier protein
MGSSLVVLGAEPGTSGKGVWAMSGINEQDLRWLLELLQEQGLAEIEVHDGGMEATVSNLVAQPTSTALLFCPPPAAAEAATPAPLELGENLIPVLSPMAGVFYWAPSPGAAPFVKIGDHVEHGDTLALVEAMKLFSEVPAPASGTIVRFLIENEQAVEADQCLMVIERTKH